jgi:HrpA-like RNA helicase
MRVASILICDIIEKLDCFGDGLYEKKSVLCFLPGMAEIFMMMDFITEWYKHDERLLKTLEFIPLHSSLNEGE